MADLRDLRDPQALGEAIMTLRKELPDSPVTNLASLIDERYAIAAYPGDYSSAAHTTAVYRTKMRKQAEEGDRAARRVCVEHDWYDQDDAWAEEIAAEVRRTREMQARGVNVDPDVETRGESVREMSQSPHLTTVPVPDRQGDLDRNGDAQASPHPTNDLTKE